MKDFDDDVWKLVTELAEQERHFNGVQHHYRLLASTWLLAMFGGIGFALSTEIAHVPAGLLVAVLGLAGAVGLTQLWNLDIRVYHQLLDSCFVQGLALERDHPWLPQLRTAMLASQEEPAPSAGQQPGPKGVSAKVVWFYVAGTTAALLAAFAGLGASLDGLLPAPWPVVPLACIAVGVVVIVLWNRELFVHTRSPMLERWAAAAASRPPRAGA